MTRRLGLALAFALAYAQAPLYTENQNAYLLRPLARAGVGSLDRDWAANTPDPFPLFSTLVAMVLRVAPSWWLNVAYLASLGLYAWAMAAIVTSVARLEHDRRHVLVVWASITVLHSAALISSARLVGLARLPEMLHQGYAHSILGPVLQPSVSGALLIVSIWIYLRGRPVFAAGIAALAATLHASYLFSAATLTLSYMLGTWRVERKWSQVALIGGVSIAAVLPAIGYNIAHFAPTTPETFRQANAILYERISREAHVSGWFGPYAILQTAVLIGGILAARRTPMFDVLVIPSSLMALGTLVQAMTDNPALGLATPWRASAWLVPLCSCLIVGRGVAWAWPHVSSPRAIRMAAIAISACAAAGVVVSVHRARYAAQLEDRGVLEFVRAHRTPNDLYLIPVTLQSFRLYTGAPAFIDQKTHPYEDTAVLEWRRRLQLAQDVYVRRADDRCASLNHVVTGYAITHVVAPLDLALPCPNVKVVFEDGAYRLFMVVRPTVGAAERGSGDLDSQIQGAGSDGYSRKMRPSKY